jgi:hypothetical protein
LNDRLFPAKLVVAIIGLLFSIGLFFVALSRGGNAAASGPVASVLAAGIGFTLWRRKHRAF